MDEFEGSVVEMLHKGAGKMSAHASGLLGKRLRSLGGLGSVTGTRKQG
jgi:hypothetical protein